MRRAVNQRNLQSLQREESWILQLRLPRRSEKSKRRVVANPRINRQMRRHPPEIFDVNSEPLHVLRKAAVSRGRRFARCSGSRLQAAAWRAREIHRKLLRIANVIRGVHRERGEALCISGERAAEHRLMNEINSEARRMVSARMAHVISELIFFL